MDKDQIKIKKGNLNYDQSGRAYPDNPELKENWDCIWEHDDKYYELVGDYEHKEWEEVKIYDRIIDEVYENYRVKSKLSQIPTDLTREGFVESCKNDITFSVYWGLKIEERELSDEERVILLKELEIFQERVIDNAKSEMIHSLADSHSIPTKLITLTYNNEKIEIYE